MKISADHGFAIEARELVAYDVVSDGYLVRYDTVARGKPYAVWLTPPSINAEDVLKFGKDAVGRLLVPQRMRAALRFRELLAADGVDASECEAPPIPDGYFPADWVK